MGGEMGSDGGGRDKSTEITNGHTSELAASVLRGVDTATALIVALREAVSREDRQRIAVLKADLNSAWTGAQSAIDKLEQLSGRREIVARAALMQSQESARGICADVWKLVTNGGESPKATANK